MKMATQPLPVKRARIRDPFWGARMETVRTKMLPYQWEALSDRVPGAEPSHSMRNFRVAAGLEAGEHGGFVFQDSDYAKWLEAVAYSLMWHPDPFLEQTADGSIDVVVAAQQPDGYLDTYYIITGLERRWSNVMDNHELYCAGHLTEAAVAYWEATGKDKLLRAVCRLADCIARAFGPEEGKRHGYPGHEVLEMALVRLWHATGEGRYLRLAQYFIEARGTRPLYFEEEMKRAGAACHWQQGPLGLMYYQAGRPVREQMDAEGHAVRAMYLYCGMADVARETGDPSLAEACERLWHNAVHRRMYLTGGVGSSAYGEAFTFDYDLPNDTAYAETCAAIGLVFFARRMLELRPRGEYADVMERALYNGVISGMSLEGTSFFYVNPLEVLPEACEKDQLRRHVKVQRQKWFGCSCCPPNLARLICSLGGYICGTGEGTVFVHLYVGGEYDALVGGRAVRLSVQSGLPGGGEVRIRLASEGTGTFTLALRIPGWCREYALEVCGERVRSEVREGYAYLSRTWQEGDEVALHLSLEPVFIEANLQVRADIGKVALTRGPLVYCLEEADNGPGLHRIRLGGLPEVEVQPLPDLLGGVTALSCRALRQKDAGGALYRPAQEIEEEEVRLRFIPYYAWANRGPGEMTVWVRR